MDAGLPVDMRILHGIHAHLAYLHFCAQFPFGAYPCSMDPRRVVEFVGLAVQEPSVVCYDAFHDDSGLVCAEEYFEAVAFGPAHHAAAQRAGHDEQMPFLLVLGLSGGEVQELQGVFDVLDGCFGHVYLLLSLSCFDQCIYPHLVDLLHPFIELIR